MAKLTLRVGAMAEKPGQMCVETHTLRNQKAGYPFIPVYTAAYALWSGYRYYRCQWGVFGDVPSARIRRRIQV